MTDFDKMLQALNITDMSDEIKSLILQGDIQLIFSWSLDGKFNWWGTL
jgi:hypothetical protein